MDEIDRRKLANIEELAKEEFKNVGDEGLFPNHSDRDIWVAGFVACYLLLEKTDKK